MSLRAFILLALIALVSLAVVTGSSRSAGARNKAAIETPSKMAEIASMPNTVKEWPPRLGEEFPPVPLFDHTGKSFDLRTLRGKPLLVEFVAMTCGACQAWSGGQDYGSFKNLQVQRSLESIEYYYRKYTGGLELFDGSVHFVQLVVYDTKLEAPAPSELAEWRSHFGFESRPYVHVVSGGEPLRNVESFRRIPGFLLLDKDLVVRFDALGHQPKNDLFGELLPGVRSLLR